jgi:hypothetical protein
MIPDGWYMVLPSSALRSGQTHTEQALCTQLTITRQANGAVSVTDATGATRQVLEVNDMITVWEGDGKPGFAIEACAELSDRAWTGVRWGRSPVYQTSVVNVQRDVVDNDHFAPVHHLEGAETTAQPAGPYLDTVSQGIMNLRRLGGPPMLCHIRLTGRLHGVGLLTYRTTITLGTQLCSLVLSAPTPIDAHTVRFHVGISVKRLFPVASEVMRYAVLASVLKDISRDAQHWETPVGRLGEDRARAAEQVRMFGVFDRWLEQHQTKQPARLQHAVAQ